MSKEEFLAIAAKRYEAIKSLSSHDNFYDYEKEFEAIIQEMNREMLEKSLGDLPQDRRKKKKVYTRYGRIGMSKAHRYIEVLDDYGISPRYRELLIFLGQKECYARGSLELELVLGLKASDSQIHRLTNDYGARVESLLAQETPTCELNEDQVVYAQVDGSMVFTRESNWQEVKIGRVFGSSDRVPISKARGYVHQSEYAAYLGSHSAFERRMSVLLDKYEYLAERLVFITDGAPWIAKWIQAEYPKATHDPGYFSCQGIFEPVSGGLFW